MIIGTAGHIDHGKTALVKALTGVDTDRLPEEKRRGITVELGFAPLDLNGIASSVIDVPGHEAFVKTMVAGAAGIDVALLVIAADEGIMPQTREHAGILEILRIPKLVVALTKNDLADAEWRDLVREEVNAMLASTPWPEAPIVACSATSGDGLAELRDALVSAAPASQRGSSDDLFRLPVDRSFTVKGTGTVVTGTVWSGLLSEGETVRILPGGKSARVRRVQKHGVTVERASPGDRAAIALVGMEVDDVPRGSNIITHPDWEPTTVLDAAVQLLPASRNLDTRSEVTVHLAGADVSASVRFLNDESLVDHRFARIKLQSPIAARGGDRFVLRLPAPIGTIGGGIVLDPFPGRASLSMAAQAFERIATTEAQDRLRYLIALDENGLLDKSLSVRLGIAPQQVPDLLAAAGCVLVGGRWHPSATVSSAADSVEKALAHAETTFPLEAGVQLESVQSLAGLSADVTRAAVEMLVKGGKVNVHGSLIARTGWKPSLDGARSKTVELLVHAICSAGSEPPTSAELSDRYGKEVPGLLRYLEREGRLVQVAPDRFYARDEVNALIEKLRKNLEAGAEYGPSQLRDVLGFSRKYLIPFLEYCDRAGITERKGDGRILRSVRVSLTQM